MGTFAAPNRAGVMNSLPPQHRGVGSGMNSTFASGLHTAFDFAIAACLAAAAMSWLRGGKYHYREEAEPVPVQTTKAA